MVEETDGSGEGLDPYSGEHLSQPLVLQVADGAHGGRPGGIGGVAPLEVDVAGGEEFGHTVVSRPSIHVPTVVCVDVERPGVGADQFDEHSVERLLPGGSMDGGGGG